MVLHKTPRPSRTRMSCSCQGIVTSSCFICLIYKALPFSTQWIASCAFSFQSTSICIAAVAVICLAKRHHAVAGGNPVTISGGAVDQRPGRQHHSSCMSLFPLVFNCLLSTVQVANSDRIDSSQMRHTLMQLHLILLLDRLPAQLFHHHIIRHHGAQAPGTGQLPTREHGLS